MKQNNIKPIQHISIVIHSKQQQQHELNRTKNRPCPTVST